MPTKSSASTKKTSAKQASTKQASAKQASKKPASAKRPATLVLRTLKPVSAAESLVVPSRYVGFAAGAPVSVWADARRAVRVERGADAAIVLPVKPAKGSEIAAVTVSDDGTRVGLLITTPGRDAQIHVVEADGTIEVHEGYVAIGFAEHGAVYLARTKEVLRLTREGVASGASRPTGGYLAAHIRSDGAVCFAEYGRLRVLLADGRSVALAAGDGPVAAARMHPTLPLVAGQWIDEGVIRVFDWTDGRQVLEVAALWCRGALSFAFSPDGGHIAAVGPGIVVYALATGVQVLAQPGGRELTGGFADAATLQISGGVLRTHTLAGPAAASDAVFSLAVAPDGERLALERGGRVELWSARSGEKLADLTVTGADRVAFAGGGAVLLVTTRDATVALDAVTGALLHTLPLADGSAVEVAVAANGSHVIVADAALTRFEVGSWRAEVLMRDEAGFSAVAYTGDLITARRGDGAVIALDARSGAVVAEMAVPASEAGTLTATRVHGGWLLAASDEALIGAKLDGAKLRGKVLQRGLAGPVVASADGRRLLVITAQDDRAEARILDESLAPIGRFAADNITAATFDAGASRLLVSRDGRLEVVDLP